MRVGLSAVVVTLTSKKAYQIPSQGVVTLHAWTPMRREAFPQLLIRPVMLPMAQRSLTTHRLYRPHHLSVALNATIDNI